MEAKYTPGPWKIGGVVDGAEMSNATVTASNRIVADVGFESNGSANARLIAAAPEMLEALEDIVQQFERTRIMVGTDLADSIRVFGKQAIAKAKGE